MKGHLLSKAAKNLHNIHIQVPPQPGPLSSPLCKQGSFHITVQGVCKLSFTSFLLEVQITVVTSILCSKGIKPLGTEEGMQHFQKSMLQKSREYSIKYCIYSVYRQTLLYVADQLQRSRSSKRSIKQSYQIRAFITGEFVKASRLVKPCSLLASSRCHFGSSIAAAEH